MKRIWKGKSEKKKKKSLLHKAKICKAPDYPALFFLMTARFCDTKEVNFFFLFNLVLTFVNATLDISKVTTYD